jgi:hypothetical protein
MTNHASALDLWPPLAWDEWKETASTLHMWTQIVGKTRLALTPLMNHWWNVPLYVSAHGLSTSAIPYEGKLFEVEFDFVQHQLHVRVSSGAARSVALRPQSVASFYDEYMSLLHSLGIEVKIHATPDEVSDPIPFRQDDKHASYDGEYAHRFWLILSRADVLFKRFRARFLGKSSPVHFFWGSFDLAVTRFSGRPAPPRPNADAITREAYSHEVISAGFWPGNGGLGTAAFYCYAAPEPPGLDRQPVWPTQAFYSNELKEFILKYDDVRAAESPDHALMEFLQSSYEAAAILAGWDRMALERSVFLESATS